MPDPRTSGPARPGAVQPLQAAPPRTHRAWTVVQAAAGGLGVALVVGLLIRPAGTLAIFWNVVVPALPALFLLNPRIWRNVCPLATANQLSGARWGRIRLSAVQTRSLGLLGIALFFALVPARRIVLNTSAVSLAVVLVTTALVAFVVGLVFATRAGFCNTLCPVLPVERLYGQSPLIRVPNARCSTCALCTGAGCVDLAPRKSVVQTLGRSRKSARWLFSPFGAFAAALPGFVVGYFTTPDGPLSTAGRVYGHVAAWAAASFGLTVVLVLLLRLQSRTSLLGLGGLAAGLFFWFVSPSAASTVGLGAPGSVTLRVLTLGLVIVWLARGLSAGSPASPAV